MTAKIAHTTDYPVIAYDSNGDEVKAWGARGLTPDGGSVCMNFLNRDDAIRYVADVNARRYKAAYENRRHNALISRDANLPAWN